MSQKNIEYKTLTVNISKGKFGDYMYKSPRYGYKHAYHYDTSIQIIKNDEIVARFMTKRWYKKYILQYIEDVYQFTETKDFSNMVTLYKRAKELGIDYGYVRELREQANQ